MMWKKNTRSNQFETNKNLLVSIYRFILWNFYFLDFFLLLKGDCKCRKYCRMPKDYGNTISIVIAVAFCNFQYIVHIPEGENWYLTKICYFRRKLLIFAENGGKWQNCKKFYFHPPAISAFTIFSKKYILAFY